MERVGRQEDEDATSRGSGHEVRIMMPWGRAKRSSCDEKECSGDLVLVNRQNKTLTLNDAALQVGFVSRLC